tara:strand:- start:289 stop:504 length:216 start_codon:yes stop_codon:yes gene_type:complete
MAQQTIKFTIRQDGTVTEEVMGVIGNECESLTKRVEERLGNMRSRDHKPEYYQSLTVEETIQEFTHDSEGC